MRGNMKKRNSNKKVSVKYGILLCIIILGLVFCGRKDDLQKGVDALQKGDYVKAVKTLNVTLNIDSLNPEVHFNLCLAYGHLDSVQKSLHHYEKVCELESPLMNDSQLKEMLAIFLKLEPFTSSIIPMKRMHQFKGAFSPDGKSVLVAAAKRARADIYLVELDGRVIEKITKSGMNTDPAFSPLGDHITFVSNVDGDDELFLYNIRTREIEKLTDNKAQDFSPSFSPDGKEIVFVSNMHDQYKWEIYKINVVNKKIKRLTNNKYWDAFAKFSSDGKFIVFSSKRNGTEDIYIMNKNGGGESVLYTTSADNNDPQLLGDLLYFKTNIDGEWEIYRYDLKNKRLLRLTNNNRPDWNPRISVDGTKMLVARKMKKWWRLYFINLESQIPAEVIVSKIKESV